MGTKGHRKRADSDTKNKLLLIIRQLQWSVKSILKNFLFFALIYAKNTGEGDILRQSTSIFYVRGSHRNHGNHRKRLFVTLNEITVNLYFHSALTDYGLWPDVWADMNRRAGRYERSCKQIWTVMQADTTSHAGRYDRSCRQIRPALLLDKPVFVLRHSIESALTLYRDSA